MRNNRYRWKFGVLAPRTWVEGGGCEAWWLEAQLLIAGEPERLGAQLRFVQIECCRREDGISRAIDVEVGSTAVSFACEPWRTGDREYIEVRGRLDMRRERAGDLTRVTIRVENTTPWTDLGASREQVLAASLASTHLLVSAPGAEILSANDPPDGAPRVTNIRTYPALVGHDLAIAAPFIRQDQL